MSYPPASGPQIQVNPNYPAPAQIQGTIENALTPPTTFDGLGLSFPEEEQFFLPQNGQHSNSTKGDHQEELTRKRLNQHVYEVLQAVDKGRERHKRVRVRILQTFQQRRTKWWY
jgi:hypothetical protein